MNMQNLMMQARKMQKDIENIQKELEKSTYEGKSQLVTVIINGKSKVTSVKINSEIDDSEMLEDMVLIAINDAMEKMQKDKEDKLGKYNSMLNGLM